MALELLSAGKEASKAVQFRSVSEVLPLQSAISENSDSCNVRKKRPWRVAHAYQALQGCRLFRASRGPRPSVDGPEHEGSTDSQLDRETANASKQGESASASAILVGDRREG